jgi:catechol 2,3-dioxygenase-like lactoylglutathione lyase family enzyme
MNAPRRRLVHLTAVVAASVAIIAAHAEPVPESERIPVDLRRTTLVVRDIDTSLALYRDALGMTVIYDEMIGGGTDAEGTPIAPRLRLVLLRANDRFIGALGLMQRLNAPPPPRPPNARPNAGGVILVFNASDLDTRYEKIRSAPGVTVDQPPGPVEYPRPGGGTIPVLFSSIYDNDGFFIEINKILAAPAGQ